MSSDTVATYVHHCESAYLFLPRPYFSYSEKQRVRRNNKYYPIDPAFRNSVVTKTGKDLGKAFESVVFLELKRACDDVFYWKGNGEVDFVVSMSISTAHSPVHPDRGDLVDTSQDVSPAVDAGAAATDEFKAASLNGGLSFFRDNIDIFASDPDPDRKPAVI